VPAGVLAAALAAQTAAAAVRPALFTSTAKAAVLTEAGLVSAQVASLTQGVIKTMLLNKLKVLTVLILGVALGGFGAGVLGVPGRGEPAARAAQSPPAQTASAQRAEPEEPLDAGLLLDAGIQKELRLSTNQVQRLREAAAEAGRKHEGTRNEVKQLQQQIERLQNQIQALNQKIGTDRDDAVRRAAPDILSARALERLRQIQRQRRGPGQLLLDPRVQRLLKLDDEQMMKIEKAVKEFQVLNFDTIMRVPRVDVNFLQLLARENQIAAFGDVGVNRVALTKVAEVLTPQQRRALQALVGEPAPGSGWDWLWHKDAKKGR
jgi:hypothetical protein